MTCRVILGKQGCRLWWPTRASGVDGLRSHSPLAGDASEADSCLCLRQVLQRQMFLQAAIDAPSLANAGASLRRFADNEFVDRIEIGAPLLSHYGVQAAHYFAARWDAKRLYADTKLIDFPTLELGPYLRTGIRHFSAMAFMSDESLRELRLLAKEQDFSVLISTMGFPLSLLQERVCQIREIGFADFICHGAGAPDAAFSDMIVRATALRGVTAINLVAAGGIDPINAHELAVFNFSGLIVGRGLNARTDINVAAGIVKDAFRR